jgi:hypothetical protein
MKIIFLDIDGVIQPPWKQDRFKHDLEALRAEIAEKYQDPAYLEFNKYDLGATYADWSEVALANLRQLLVEQKAKIVISSDWRRSHNLQRMQMLFRLYDLDEYIIDCTEILEYPLTRGAEIQAYLDAHPEIKKFVILDDLSFDFRTRFPNEWVQCMGFIEEEQRINAERVLKGKKQLAPKKKPNQW